MQDDESTCHLAIAGLPTGAVAHAHETQCTGSLLAFTICIPVRVAEKRLCLCRTSL